MTAATAAASATFVFARSVADQYVSGTRSGAFFFAVGLRTFTQHLNAGSRAGISAAATRTGTAGISNAARGFARLAYGDERIAHDHRLARFSIEFQDCAFERARDLNNGFSCLDLGDNLVDLDRVAFGDVPGHQVSFGEAFPEVRESERLCH